MTGALTGAAARKARKHQRQDRRRREFLDAAQAVLRNVGLTRMTMADIAREAGEIESLLYYYFENRDSLLLSLAVSNILRDLDVMTKAVDAADGGIEAMTALVRSMVGIYRDDLESFKLRMWLAMRPVPDDALQQIYPRINHMIDLVEQQLRKDQKHGKATSDLEARARAGVALTQAEGILMNYTLIEGIGAKITIELDRILDEACKQAVSGLAKRST